jgi:hypothetical protein
VSDCYLMTGGTMISLLPEVYNATGVSDCYLVTSGTMISL